MCKFVCLEKDSCYQACILPCWYVLRFQGFVWAEGSLINNAGFFCTGLLCQYVERGTFTLRTEVLICYEQQSESEVRSSKWSPTDALNFITVSVTICVRLLFSGRTDTRRRKIRFLLFNKQRHYISCCNSILKISTSMFLFKQGVTSVELE